MFLGTLWSSIKKVKDSYVFDGEHRIALHPMKVIQASSPAVVDVSWDFLSCGRNLGYILELWQRRPFKTPVCSVTSGLLSSYEEQLKNLFEAWQGNMDAF